MALSSANSVSCSWNSFNSCLPHCRCFCLSIRNLLQQSGQKLELGLREELHYMFSVLQTLAEAACFELRHVTGNCVGWNVPV